MSLNHLDTQIENLRAEATKNYREAKATADGIRADKKLSPVGKSEQIKVYEQQLREKNQRLLSEEERLVAENKQRLSRTIAGTVGSDPTSVISFRDATERAERFKNDDEALEGMTRALKTRDGELAKAILNVSLDKGWRRAVDPYLAENPSTAEAITDYRDLVAWDDSMEALISRSVYMVGATL